MKQFLFNKKKIIFFIYLLAREKCENKEGWLHFCPKKKDGYIWIITYREVVEEYFPSQPLFLTMRKDIKSLLELLLISIFLFCKTI